MEMVTKKVMKVVITGVSGSGKSTIAQALAEQLGCIYYDGDDFHSPENIQKMQAGIPLTDQDRAGWLTTLAEQITQQEKVVLACSALKPAYRQQLKNKNPDLIFVYLQGDFDTIWQRHKQRQGHYFAGKAMLESQFATLIEPTASEAIIIDIRQSVDKIIQKIVIALPQQQ